MSLDGIVVPKGWELVKISNIGDVITGSTPSTSNLEYYGNDFPFYSPSDLNSNIEISRANKGLSHKGLEVARKIPEDSILVQCIGDLGRCNIIKKTGACNQQINVIIPNKKLVIPKFVYFWIKSAYFNYLMKQESSKTTLPILNKSKFRNLPFLRPSIDIQKTIIQKLDHILGELEVKKKEIISLIEQNKQRIDFFEKNWINYIISTLIPKKEIPNGWSLLPLSEICNVERGKFGHRPRNDPAFYGGKYPFIQTGDVARSNGRVSKFSQTLNENGFKVSRMFPKGTVVITIAANIGDTAILEFDSCFPDSLIGITPITGKTIAEYVEYALRLYQKDLTRDASQGTQKNINYDFLKPLLIPIPKTITEQENIVRKIKSAEEKFQSQKKQFENIKNNYESKINYINHIQSSVLDSAFSGKLIQ